MKRRSRHQILTALSACMLLSLSNPGVADEAVATPDPDTSKWVCKLCLVSNGWFGEWDLGLILVDDATPKFADYHGLIDDGAYLQASGNSSFRNEDGYYFDFYGRNLGLAFNGKRGQVSLDFTGSNCATVPVTTFVSTLAPREIRWNGPSRKSKRPMKTHTGVNCS